MPVKMGKESVYSKMHIKTQKEYEHYRKYGYERRRTAEWIGRSGSFPEDSRDILLIIYKRKN